MPTTTPSKKRCPPPVDPRPPKKLKDGASPVDAESPLDEVRPSKKETSSSSPHEDLDGPFFPTHLRRQLINLMTRLLPNEPYRMSQEEAEAVAKDIELVAYNTLKKDRPSIDEDYVSYTKVMGDLLDKRSAAHPDARSSEYEPKKDSSPVAAQSLDEVQPSKNLKEASSSVDPQSLDELKKLPSPHEDLDGSFFPSDLRQQLISSIARLLPDEPYRISQEEAETVAKEIELVAYNTVKKDRPHTHKDYRSYIKIMGNLLDKTGGAIDLPPRPARSSDSEPGSDSESGSDSVSESDSESTSDSAGSEN